jgi:hypothetical protein
MLKLVEYDLEDGSSIWIEVDELKQQGLRKVGSKEKNRKLKRYSQLLNLQLNLS